MSTISTETFAILSQHIDLTIAAHQLQLKLHINDLLIKFVADTNHKNSSHGTGSGGTPLNVKDAQDLPSQSDCQCIKEIRKGALNEARIASTGDKDPPKTVGRPFASETSLPTSQPTTPYHAVQMTTNLSDIQGFVEEHTAYHKYVQLFGRFGHIIAWFEELREPHRSGHISNFVQSRTFELFTLIIIILNSAYSLHDTNWQMKTLLENRPVGMIVTEACFTGFYALELTAKLVVHGIYFFCNDEARWNIFDFVLVVLSVIDCALTLIWANAGFINTGFLRIIRILKLVKILRFFRVLQFVSELRLMLQCVMGSISSLLWSFILLGLFTVVFAILFVQQLSLFVIENSSTMTQVDKDSVRHNFGSVQLAVLSLFQGISGGQDWAVYYETIKQAGPFSSTIFIIYMLFIWLSVTNIITSLFVEKAMKFARPDLEEQLIEKRKDDLKSACDLKKLFMSMDENQSGTLTIDEFERSMKDVKITSYFDLKGLSVSHASMFFKLLASLNEAHQIDIDTFVTGCLRMRGVASNIDMIALLFQTRLLAENIGGHIRASRQEMAQLRHELQSLRVKPVVGHVFV